MKITGFFLVALGAIVLFINLHSQKSLNSEFIVDTVKGTVGNITYPYNGDYKTVYHLKEYPSAVFRSYASDAYLETVEALTGENPWEIGGVYEIDYLRGDKKPNVYTDDGNDYDLVALRKNGVTLIDKELYIYHTQTVIYLGKIFASVLFLFGIGALLSVYYAKKLQENTKKKLTQLLSVQGEKGAWGKYELFVKLEIYKPLGNHYLAQELLVQVSVAIPYGTKKKIGKSFPFHIDKENNAKRARLVKRSIRYSFNQKKFIRELDEAIAKYEVALEKFM